MSAIYFAIPTNAGQARIANAIALGIPLKITHMAIGDGNGQPVTPNPAQTSLAREVRRAPLNTLFQDPINSAQLVAEQIIPEDVGGWWVREVGLYDDSETLIAVANAPDTYKPLLTSGAGRTQTIRMALIVSDTSAVELKIDPSIVLATRKYVDDVMNAYSEKSGLARGNDGVKYALSAAAFRRDTAQSNNWFVISDTAHIPVNSRGIEGGVNPKIMYKGKKIGALILSPDETLAMDGVSVGGSVGFDYALMSMGADCSFSVDLDTGQFAFDTHYFDQIRFGLVINEAGVVTLTHPEMRLMRDAIVRYVSPSSTDKNLQVHYQQTPTAGITTLFLLGDVEGTVSYNGTEWVVGSSDQWKTSDLKFTWDQDTGVLLVEHGLLVGSPTLTVTMLDLGAGVYTAASQAGSSSFRVKFRKHDGSIPSLSTALGFYFYRGESGIRKQPKGKLLVHLGHVQVNGDHFSHPQGNVWSLGLMEN